MHVRHDQGRLRAGGLGLRAIVDRWGSAVAAIWLRPKCGARLVSRNLWHSCGRFSLDELFASAAPGVLELAREYVAMLRSLGTCR